MVKMRNGGITTSVPEKEVSFYVRAGYSVVVEEIPAPVVDPEPIAPAEGGIVTNPELATIAPKRKGKK